jgi:cytochrome c-type biogenesis protein CcmH
MVLWIGLAVMTALAALAVLLPLLRSAAPEAVATTAGDVAVYKDQLAELGRDRDAGLIGAGEAEAARVEVARRLLRASRETETATGAGAAQARRFAAIAIVVALPAISLPLYLGLGSPDAVDQPLVARASKPLDQLSPGEQMAWLDATVAARPEDGKLWDVAAQLYLYRFGRPDDAAAAASRAISLLGGTVERQVLRGEALVMAAEGVVTAEARIAFEAALVLDPKAMAPRMYLAKAREQDGDKPAALDAWKALKAEAKGEEPWLEVVDSEIAKLEGRPPPPPSAPALDAEQSAAIDGMVTNLANRLERDGGNAEDWSKLMRSYRVLGRPDDARATLAKARAALKDDAAALAALDDTAKQLGL